MTIPFKSLLKPLACVLLGLLALLGLGTSALVAVFFCTGSHSRVKAYTGEECVRSIAARQLPLPPQDEDSLPMAVDFTTPMDYTGAIVFRAPAEWQQALLTLFPQAETNLAHAKGLAEDMVGQAGHEAMADFIGARNWQLIHQGHFAPEGGPDAYDFATLRDESGEHLLILFMDY